MITKVLRRLMDEQDLSILDVAKKADLPVETVKNLAYEGRVLDPKASTVRAIAKVFNVSMNYMFGEPFLAPDEVEIVENYRRCGRHGKSLIALTAKYECNSTRDEKTSSDKHTIPCLIPHGDIRKGIVYDACETIEIETSNKDAYVAIQMPSNDLAPLYCEGDIMLFENRFPTNGEYAAFYKDGKAYIRKFIKEDKQYRLKCLHGEGVDFVMKRMDQMDYIGTCIGAVRV